MPRTKQNHPKNLKDKIEEAQKQLKEPKATQNTSSALRPVDNTKGLKRKKVVAESKKLPKSPVKKPVQSCEPDVHSSPTKETTPSPSSPSHNPPSSPNGKEEPQHVEPVAVSLDEGSHSSEAEGVKQEKASTQPTPQELSDCKKAEESPPEDSKTPVGSFKGGSYSSSAPLDVLLQAMEPDFSTLADKDLSVLAAGISKPAASLQAQLSGEVTALPAVSVALQTQPSQMQTYYIDKQGNFFGIAAALQGAVQPSTQGTGPLTASHLLPISTNVKQGLHMNFSSGPSAVSHTPAPSGPSALPQSQPPVVHTCQSISASVPSTIQVPVTPGSSHVQMTTVMNVGAEQTSKDQKPKKPGKYVCEYCQRACAKPSVLLKHIRSHTGERPYPCVTCGFSFKTKSNLYKHKKSHAHAIKLGMISRSESGGGSLSTESDKAVGAQSEVEESGDSDDEGSAVDLEPESSQSSIGPLSDCSSQNVTPLETDVSIKSSPGRRAHEPKVPTALPKVVVYPVNVSPLRADSPRVAGAAPEQAAAQRQREFQATRPNITVLSSLKEVDGTSGSLDAVSEDEEQQCKSPLLGSHGQLQRQQATDYSQQQQPKCLLSPRSLGSTDSGYFSRSESADQAMSPPSPFVKITPPVDAEVAKSVPLIAPPVVSTVMHVAADQRMRPSEKVIRHPLEPSARSLEERISKLISDNEAVVDNKQLDSVKPRRTSLSRRGSIDSPRSYIFKDSFQFDLKPMGRRSSSSSDIPKSPFTPTDKSKHVFLLSVPNQYPPMDCLPITRSNSMPTTPGHSVPPPSINPVPHPLRGCQSFDEKISSLNDEVFLSAPPTPNPAIHSRTLVRQKAVDDFSTGEGHSLVAVRSMDEGYHGHSSLVEQMQRSRSFEHGQDRTRRPQQNKGTMYECETCRNRYRKLENFETHKKFYCSELHGPKNKPLVVKEPEEDVFHVNTQQHIPSGTGALDQQTSIRKRRKMKSVGDEDDQSPTDTIPPCLVGCEATTTLPNKSFSQTGLIVDIQPNSQSKPPQIQLVARGMNTAESRLSPIQEMNISGAAKGDLQRQGSGTSVIRHTNSLSRPNSFETESLDRVSPDVLEKDQMKSPQLDRSSGVSTDSYQEKAFKPTCDEYRKLGREYSSDSMSAASSTPVHQSRLVRQSNILVPEILVTEDSDREHEPNTSEPADKPAEQFNWPQRSESLSKLPAEKLPPKKKRIRLAQMDQSSGESSFESSFSRSLSRDSSLSRGSSISASFDREETIRSESPSRGEGKTPEPQSLPVALNTLGVPGMMRRAASEQITCTQPSVEISCDYRSKSFDCSNVSPRRCLSPIGQPKTGQVAQVPLIERRRGPLVRQMSLKIGPESQQPVRKSAIGTLDKALTANVSSLGQYRSQQINIVSRRAPVASAILNTAEPPLKQHEQLVQSINLGSPTQQQQVHGLPHPWYQTAKVQFSQKVQQALSKTLVCGENLQDKPSDFEKNKSFVPKYQLQCPSQTFSFCTQGAQIALPILTIPIANPILSISKSSDIIQNVFVASQQASDVKTQTVVFSSKQQKEPLDHSQTGTASLPQILITHEQMHQSSSQASKHYQLSTQSAEVPQDRTQTAPVPAPHTADHSSLGSLQCMQKLASVTLCPQQEPTASSKRMLSPANSLDIYMEKHQKRAKDEHGVACLTDGRSAGYLNSKISEVSRQRKLMLVRQVCTTEPVDSPIETEAPPLPDLKPNEEKNSEADDGVKPMSPDAVGLEKGRAKEINEKKDPVINTTSLPPDNSLKPQEKSEEQRWTPAKSLIRPSSFHAGQVKLTTSVSAVNTKEAHRLSFPSLKTTTTFTWCFLMKRKLIHMQQTDLKISAYAAWTVSTDNSNPLGLPTKVVLSLFDSKHSSRKIHYTSAIRTSRESDILSFSGKLKDVMLKMPASQKSVSSETRCKPQPEPQTSHDSEKDVPLLSEPRRVKIFDGGFKSNEEYVYVRGRGRGKYICEECGIRCKKPSMLRKHIRTHSDVRPFHCVHCNFSFKTKGNLTKHMKSKAHRKKCMEMGVPEGVMEDQDAEDSGDRSQLSGADRQDSDGDDSDGPDDDDNDEEEEDDSQAESGLSTNPSVSASPQHLPYRDAEFPPSALLAQMSISSVPASQPAAPEPPASDFASAAFFHPQTSVSCRGSAHLPASPPPAVTSDSYASDPESVHMMSPISPCRQMSIDYPDFDGPFSPPAQGKVYKLGQDPHAPPSTASADSNTPVDRSTQTSYPAQVPPPLPPHTPMQAVGAQTHLFSHLPLHSQQPAPLPYSMLPVGGIQLLPAGLATFLPIQAGPVQLTIPAVSVIHRNTSPLPPPNTPPHPESLQTHPVVVQEPLSSVVPCFPLGQVAGLQAQTLQPVGLETLNLMGLTNPGLASTPLLPPQGLTLNTALGLQVLAANPNSQSSAGPQAHVPGLQIVNIALPAIIPSLNPLSALSPRPGSLDMQSSPEASSAPPAGPAWGSVPPNPGGCSPSMKQTVEWSEKEKPPPQRPASAPQIPAEHPKSAPDPQAVELAVPVFENSRQTTIDDYNEASSDDEDRLVIAT
uniref:Zinc finger protein 40 n=1 Tax=Oryzias latipes TaxID=8090 RepID=A0A3P9MDI8_ORYLA